MHIVAKVLLGAAVLASGAAIGAYGQGLGTSEIGTVNVNDPPGPIPDPTHIPFLPPGAIKWPASNGTSSQTIRLCGDPSKPGMYAQLLKWFPGTGTRPHIHDQDRFVYVVSGTWYVGTGNHYDPKQSFPMPAGSFLVDVANKVHWDGVRAGAEPAVIYLVGVGPVKTIQVDENGNPLPAGGGGGGRGAGGGGRGGRGGAGGEPPADTRAPGPCQQ
jgi:hypothetical protein